MYKLYSFKNKSNKQLKEDTRQLITDLRKTFTHYIATMNDVETKKLFKKRNYSNINTKYLYKHSKLDWENKTYTNKSNFRMKFATASLVIFYTQMPFIVQRSMLGHFTKSSMKNIRKERIKLIMRIHAIVNNYGKRMMAGNEYSSYLLKINNLLRYADAVTKKSLKKQSIRGELTDSIAQEIKTGYRHKPGHPAYYNKDRRVEGLFLFTRLASLLCVDDENLGVKSIKKFKKALEDSTEPIRLTVLKMIGKAIEGAEELSPLFQFFLKEAKIRTVYKKEANEDPEVKYGLFALSYVEFVLNDDYVTEAINNIIRRKVETGLLVK